jgi:hypothetical protein
VYCSKIPFCSLCHDIADYGNDYSGDGDSEGDSVCSEVM